MFFFLFGILLLALVGHSNGFRDYYVTISNDGPVIFGANITFKANLFKSNDERPEGKYKYEWRDNLYPQNEGESWGNSTSTWVINYPYKKYHERPGTHYVEVTVYEGHYIIDWPLCRAQVSFMLTDLLNGTLTLIQDNITKNDGYISNMTEVNHEIVINTPNLNYINQGIITTFWYVDCELVHSSHNLSYRRSYTDVGASHDIVVFLLTSNLPNVNNTLSVQHEVSNSSAATGSTIDLSNSTNNDVRNFSTSGINIPFCCANRSIIGNYNNSAEGIFSSRFRVKAPVNNLTVAGNTWLPHGDMLNLQITCYGSGPFKNCFKILNGFYNVTGNETCPHPNILENCDINVIRYLFNASHYSMLLIIHNDLNKVVRSIGIDVYDVTRHPQLSVIVVPVSATIVALVLIIIGIAYYFQNKHTFTIEVADFDFATNVNGMEYKTFRERLLEAIHNAFDRDEEFDEQESSNGVPSVSSRNRYGSMH